MAAEMMDSMKDKVHADVFHLEPDFFSCKWLCEAASECFGDNEPWDLRN